MSAAEAPATAEPPGPGGRGKSSSPRRIPVVGVVTEDEDAQVWDRVGALGAVEGVD